MYEAQLRKLAALQEQLARIEQENRLLKEAVKANNNFIRFMLDEGKVKK